MVLGRDRARRPALDELSGDAVVRRLDLFGRPLVDDPADDLVDLLSLGEELVELGLTDHAAKRRLREEILC